MHRPVFLVNSRRAHFTETAKSYTCKKFDFQQHPLSQSYGANLSSSLERVVQNALGFSPRLPVSVCGTVFHLCLLAKTYANFSRNMESATTGTCLQIPSLQLFHSYSRTRFTVRIAYPHSSLA